MIDEAHHAIAPSYTRLLAWLTGKQDDERKTVPPPLLGMSATPFRGYNEKESHRLARRFDGRLYPAPEEQGELYQTLQAAGILSEIVIEPLNYPRPFVLTEAEKKQIETFDEFPETASQRMGEDRRRNDAIARAVGEYAIEGHSSIRESAFANGYNVLAMTAIAPPTTIMANRNQLGGIRISRTRSGNPVIQHEANWQGLYLTRIRRITHKSVGPEVRFRYHFE